MLWDCNHFRIANVFNGTHYKSFSLKKKKKKISFFHSSWSIACLRREHIRSLTVSAFMVTKQRRKEKKKKRYTTLFSTKKRQINELSQIFLEANTVAKKECQM